jgi:hypothetical protein
MTGRKISTFRLISTVGSRHSTAALVWSVNMTNKPLEKLLVLCPTGHGLKFATETSLDLLTAAGAEKLRSDGNSCVAMHRCRIAWRALQRIEAEPDRWDAVFWLDGDMQATVPWVRELFDLVTLVAACRPKPVDDQVDAEEAKQWTEDDLAAWRRRNAPALVGAYVKRNDPDVMACRYTTPKIPPLKVTVDRGDGPRKYELPAVVSGMGCMMQTREAFVAHCHEAPLIKNWGTDEFGAVCSAGPGKSTDGTWAWSSEDWTYTSWEWQSGRGVYLVRHAIFGHVGESIHYPTADTKIED